MLFYNAQAGYFKTQNPTGIEDFVVTDDNVPFGIVEAPAGFGSWGLGTWSFQNNFNGAYEKLQELIGEQVFTIYNSAPGYDNTYLTQYNVIQFFNEFIPSWKKAYPNLFEYWLQHGSFPGPKGVYIPSIRRFFQTGGQYINDPTTGVTDVGTGYISGVSTPNHEFFFGASQKSMGSVDFSIALPLVINYQSPADFGDQAKMKRLVIENSRFSGSNTINIKTLSLTDCARIFPSSMPEPDYTFTPGEGGDNPFGPGGDSGPGDLPPGTFDDTSDPIPDSPLPTISAADTGFTRIYNPTLSQVQALARYLWTEETLIETIWNHIKQYFEDPMQAIIGFNLVPCRVPDGETRSFALMFVDTGIQMTAAANQFVDVDCGTLNLERYYGSALDQNPYTKVSCFLPYIGTVHLNTDEVMGAELQVKYRIDIVSGSCVAKIFVDGSVLYQYSGHCAITIPISAADFSSYVAAAIAVGSALVGMAAGAAAGAIAGGAAATGAGVVQSTGAAVASESTAVSTSGAGVPAVIGPHEFAAQQLARMSAQQPPAGGGTQASFTGLNPENISNTVREVNGAKMQIEHSGAFSGNSGYLGVRRPFLIIERPNMCLPATYGQLNGYPCMIALNLAECSGFTRVQQVQLTGCTATNPEQSEILQFLKSGVVL